MLSTEHLDLIGDRFFCSLLGDNKELHLQRFFSIINVRLDQTHKRKLSEINFIGTGLMKFCDKLYSKYHFETNKVFAADLVGNMI